MRAVIIAAIVAFAGIGAQAATLGEEGRFVINPLGGGNFEVIRLQQMGTSELWCAAASYVEVRRGLSENTPIYVRNPLGPARTASGRQGVVFSLSNAGLPAAQKRNTLTVDVVGAMVKSATARRFCRDAFTRSTK
ncbi:hypothetical protein [uncultured Sulfitobacter sp.]|uniref:hypothetical protein n=1 Tax=uncultured Sulfitobacter sp. TaxID=191468 RepID=UPI00262F540F|nr:hypothetical protein [uncultured Sulfitobacter sp.]